VLHYVVSEGEAPPNSSYAELTRRLTTKLDRRPAKLGEQFTPYLAASLWWRPTGAVYLECRDAFVQEHVEECFEGVAMRLPPESDDEDERIVAALELLRQPFHRGGYPVLDEAETEEVVRRCERLAERVWSLGPARLGEVLAARLWEQRGTRNPLQGNDPPGVDELKVGWRKTLPGWSINLTWALTTEGRWLQAAKTWSGSAGRAEIHSTHVVRWQPHDTFSDSDWTSLHESFAYHLGRGSERDLRT